MEAILDKRILSSGKEEFLIKWEGYDEPEDNTWEQLTNIDDYRHLVDERENKSLGMKKNDKQDIQKQTDNIELEPKKILISNEQKPMEDPRNPMIHQDEASIYSLTSNIRSVYSKDQNNLESKSSVLGFNLKVMIKILVQLYY